MMTGNLRKEIEKFGVMEKKFLENTLLVFRMWDGATCGKKLIIMM